MSCGFPYCGGRDCECMRVRHDELDQANRAEFDKWYGLVVHRVGGRDSLSAWCWEAWEEGRKRALVELADAANHHSQPAIYSPSVADMVKRSRIEELITRYGDCRACGDTYNATVHAKEIQRLLESA